VNGRPIHLVRTLSFEGGDEAALRNAVDVAERAARAYAAYGAYLVREDEISEWLDSTAAQLALALKAPAGGA
jgi:hypothetical protein